MHPPQLRPDFAPYVDNQCSSPFMMQVRTGLGFFLEKEMTGEVSRNGGLPQRYCLSLA
jgi:uncharacterized membrane protein